MLIQRLVRGTRNISFTSPRQWQPKFSSTRFFSEAVATTEKATGKDLVEVEIDETNRIATLVLNRAPVNSLSLEMCQAISQSIKEIENKPKIQGMILTSSNPTTLSAGLDLNELYNPDLSRLDDFWRSFQQVFLDLYGSRLAVVGAIGGNAPAAGCMLALSCDYRIMASSEPSMSLPLDDEKNSKPTPPPLIGLNEARFGIAAPPWLGQLMLRTIGFRKGEMALSLGTLFKPEEALKIGMVDELVPRDDVMDKSRKVALNWTQIPPHARVASKMLARKEFLDNLVNGRDQDVEQFSRFVLNDKVQKNLGAYLESLKRK